MTFVGVIDVNRDPRHHNKCRTYRLRVPADANQRTRRRRDRADLAPWVIAEVATWPATVRAGLVAIRIGVWSDHVRLARQHRTP